MLEKYDLNRVQTRKLANRNVRAIFVLTHYFKCLIFRNPIIPRCLNNKAKCLIPREQLLIVISCVSNCFLLSRLCNIFY